jgi:magnesium-transporting ATPase (P-type)
VDVLAGVRFELRQWGTLRVGEVIKIRKDTLIPCDCIVIKTSDPENKAFVETKGLDGETNLKLKTSFLNNIPNNVARGNDYHTFKYEVSCGAPAEQLNKFDGSISLNIPKLMIPLDSGNLLLRGCILKTVHEVIAVCCYTGPDTKVVLNSAKFEPKKSKLMMEVDKIVI